MAMKVHKQYNDLEKPRTQVATLVLNFGVAAKNLKQFEPALIYFNQCKQLITKIREDKQMAHATGKRRFSALFVCVFSCVSKERSSRYGSIGPPGICTPRRWHTGGLIATTTHLSHFSWVRTSYHSCMGRHHTPPQA